MRQVAIGFIIVGIGAILFGWPEVGLFLAIAAALVAVLAPDAQHRDAKSRNHARRIR